MINNKLNKINYKYLYIQIINFFLSGEQCNGTVVVTKAMSLHFIS